jgi:hypothetical protein
VQDTPHNEYICCWQRVLDEVARVEAQPVAEAVRVDVFFEEWPDGRQVEASAREVVVGLGHLYRQGALGRSDVHEGLVSVPRELVGYRHRRAEAGAAHGFEETLEAGWVGVKGGEEVLPTFRFVLGLSGAQRLGERALERVQPRVGHLEQAPDV